ncbi:MAG: toprim domain-containing protein [Sedimentisphaerales bacterium]|nr:toprim domain-containing protein [Sedimentisphaerales bacterium]
MLNEQINVMDLLVSLSLQPTDVGGQIQIPCPNCGDNRKHFYLDPHSGLGYCHKCQWSPNAYKLVEKLSPGKQPADIFKILEQFGLHESNKTPPPKPKLPTYEAKAQLRPATEEEINQLAQIKKVSPEALKLLRPLMEANNDVMVLPACDPGNVDLHFKPCGYLKIRMDGKIFRWKDPKTDEWKEAKYPQAPGSCHGLLGYPWLMDQLALDKKEILITEAWRDMLAAIEQGYVATASTGGASTGWNKPDKEAWGKLFYDTDVTLIFDQDEAGFRCCRKAAQRIAIGGARSVQIATLPYPLQKSHGKDLHDFVNEEKP